MTNNISMIVYISMSMFLDDVTGVTHKIEDLYFL